MRYIKTYIVKIKSKSDIGLLSEHGIITYISILVDGLFVLQSEETIEKLRKLDFIKSIEENRIGRLDI